MVTKVEIMTMFDPRNRPYLVG